MDDETPMSQGPENDDESLTDRSRLWWEMKVARDDLIMDGHVDELAALANDLCDAFDAEGEEKLALERRPFPSPSSEDLAQVGEYLLALAVRRAHRLAVYECDRVPCKILGAGLGIAVFGRWIDRAEIIVARRHSPESQLRLTIVVDHGGELAWHEVEVDGRRLERLDVDSDSD